MDLTEHTLSTEPVFDGALLHVRRDRVRTPGGEAVREWIAHPGAAAVVPLFADGTTVLIRQYRYPPRCAFLEVPAGKLDPGESPREAAEREMAEEVGLRAGRWTLLGPTYPAIGYSDEIIHLFLAEDIEATAGTADDDEHIVPVRMPLADAVGMARRGEMADGKTALALLLADAALAARDERQSG